MSDEKKKIEDRYLGDGVYASSDGFYITLDLRAQDNFTKIVLEPETLTALNQFADDNNLQEEKGYE